MGFFDLANPVLDALDGLMSALPPVVRLLLWSAVASAVTMKLYQWTSRQERMAALKADAKEAQRELASFDGEFDEMMPLIRRSLGASTKMLGLAIGPAMIASIPVIFVLAWAATRFAYVPPEPGDALTVRVTAPATTELAWTPAALQATEAAGERQFAVVWPTEEAPLTLAADGETQVRLPVATSPIVHPKQWWNALFANPAGYLPDGSPVEAVHLELAQQDFLPFGPGWLRSWLTLSLLGIFGFSLLFKFWWKIH